MAGGQAEPPITVRVMVENLRLFASVWPRRPCQTVGTPAEDVDEVARRRLADADLAQWFLHRLGHGIGVEAHEDPYLVSGNSRPLVAGNAFSIEPGFYGAGRWGARLEDIVVATDGGPVSLNQANRELVVVEA